MLFKFFSLLLIVFSSNALCQNRQVNGEECCENLKKEFQLVSKDLQNQIKDLLGEFKKLQNDMNDLSSENNELKNEVAILKQSNYDLKSKIDKSTSDIQEIQTSLQNQINEEVKLRKSVEDLNVLNANLSTEIAELAGEHTKLTKVKDISEENIALERLPMSVPNNTVYIQYPFELPPTQLWNCSQSGRWQDVSKSYADLFFRVEGFNSADWQRAQDDSAPQIEQVQASGACDKGVNCFDRRWDAVKLVAGGWSDPVFSTYYQYNDKEGIGTRFYMSDVEVRPRNMAVRIWKCLEVK